MAAASSLSPCFTAVHSRSSSSAVSLYKPFNPKSSFLPSHKKRAPKFSLDNDAQISSSVVVEEQKQLTKEVEECVRVLKNAAKTRKTPQEDILEAFSVIEKAKIDPSHFLQTLGGTNSPGRTWMLVFTAEKKLGRGKYFPITAVQRFDAAKQVKN